MFTLVLIDDDIPVHPADLKHDYRAQLKREIQKKYVDRIIPGVGLCVEFYDFARIKDAPIYPGDGRVSCGQAYFKVEFNLIVFQPSVDEWLVGRISGSNQDGITVSLGFFQDVLIPGSDLLSPVVYDKQTKSWVWIYRDKESRSREVTHFFYEQDSLIRFRIMSVEFPQAVCPQDALPRGAHMKISGAADKDGLGCVAWWPDSSPEQLSAEAAPAPLADDDDDWADTLGASAMHTGASAMHI